MSEAAFPRNGGHDHFITVLMRTLFRVTRSDPYCLALPVHNSNRGTHLLNRVLLPLLSIVYALASCIDIIRFGSS